jgi:helicase
MNIPDLDLPETVKKFYLDSTITALYPPQADAIKAGLLEGKNIVAAIPTASGKTLLAEFAMLRSIMKGGKALYIVPLRALASEKYDRFRTFGSITKPDGRSISTGIATGDLDSKDDFLGRDDLIVATSEKVDSLLRNRANWLDEITVIIADEVHLIDSPDRGPTLEIVLAKLMRNHPQVIALSATIGNANEIAKWLGAELVLSEWRPIDLKEGVFFGDAINFKDSQRKIKKRHNDSTLSLAADTLIEGGQCLVFESSRRNTEGMAARIGTAISSLIDTETKEKLALLADALRDSSEVDTAKKLVQCVQNGSAFHHAGLISEQRKIIEDGFRRGTIKVITATPTLAAGLNMPARRVIIKGYMRYDTNFGMKPIPVLEYKQMAGRAGRPGLDPYGESVLVAKNYDEFEELMQNYVSAGAEDVWSKLGTENALRTHILSTIATGFASSMEELLEFMGATFYSYQQEPWSLRAVIEKVIVFLVEKKMILEKHGLFPTELGGIVSRLYIDPLSASIIIEGMEKIQNRDTFFTELTLLQLVSSTPDLRSLYLRSNDYEWLGEFAAERHAEFVQVPAQSSQAYAWFLSDVKTACVMLDWINEVKEEDLVKKFGIGEGDIRALSENTKWLVHSMAELGKFLKFPSAQKARELVQRLEYGASPELLELIQVKGIGRVRARKLYNAGYRDIKALRESEPAEIAKLIKSTKIATKILKLVGAKIDDREDVVIERSEQTEQRSLGDFR